MLIEENQGSISESCWCRISRLRAFAHRPPANQIIHVLAKPPVKGIKIMDPITVSGQLQLQRSDVDVAMGMGKSGYRMQADAVSPTSRLCRPTERQLGICRGCNFLMGVCFMSM